MKVISGVVVLCFSLSALAAKPCYSPMAEVAYREYARSERISLSEAKESADLFVNSFKSTSAGYVYEVELAEQYVSDSESGYFPGTKLKIDLSKSCRLVSVKKI